MWDDLKRYLSGFPDGVLTAHDADGYPASVRATVAANDAGQQLQVELHADVELQPGPASLLFHNHDAQLWNQRVVLVRGTLTAAPSGWAFSPHKLVPMMGYDRGFGMLRALINCRKIAQAYLRKRGLPRPTIPWEQFKAVKSGQ